MSLRVVTRAMLAPGAAEEWRKQNSIYTDVKWRDTWEALVALGQDPTPDDVDAVIGNKTWTRHFCAACFDWTDGPWVAFGEGGSRAICADCIGLAAGALREVTK